MTIYEFEFEEFYDRLYDRFFQTELGGIKPDRARGLRSPSVWLYVEPGQEEPRALILFRGNDTDNPKYFYLKYGDVRKYGKSTIDNLAYLKAWLYLDLYPTAEIADWGKMHWETQVEKLHEKFLSIYKEKIAMRKGAGKKPVSKIDEDKEPIDSASKTPKRIYDLLDNAVYISKHVQESRRDKVVLSLRTGGKNKITGEFCVLFEDEFGRYPQKEEVLLIDGIFVHESVLAFTFDNVGEGRKHTGVMLLDYNSSKDLIGHYIVYHKAIPQGRKRSDDISENMTTGLMSLKLSTKEQAQAFLDEVRGDASAPLYVDFSTIR